MNDTPKNFPFSRGYMSESGIKTRQSQVLQHFEFAVISAVAELGSDAFPAEITRHLSAKLDRRISLAQVFIALERLEEKGFVSSRDSKPDPVRGGRRRRIFQMEASGAQAIRNTTATFVRTFPSGSPEEMLNAARQKLSPSTA